MASREGWISIHRAIQDNWIWKDGNKVKWWLDILLTVNTSTAKVNIGNDIIECKRGESLLSIQSWATRWGVSKDTARNFFTLLEKDKMICRVNLGKTTRITVCKYDTYQQPLHVKSPTAVRTHDTNNKEDNKDNNTNVPNVLYADSSPKKSATQILKDTFDARKKEFRATLIPHTKTEKNPLGKFEVEMVKEFFEKWTEPNKGRSKMKFELEQTWDVGLRLSVWKRNGFGKKKEYNNIQEVDANLF